MADELEVQTWPTEASPAVVAWALALGRELSASSAGLGLGPNLMLLKSEFRASLDGKRE
jgi:hypothetical protein